MVTEKEAKRITQYLDLHTAMPRRADLVFVFGTRHPEPAHIAVDLAQRGIGETVVLIGGGNRVTGFGEAARHLQIVLDRGVPRERVVAETDSTNTLENVTHALPRIGARVGLEKIDSVIVLTKWYHCRRAVTTLKRHLPAGIRYVASTYEPQGISRSNWWESKAGCRRVLWDHRGSLCSEALEAARHREVSAAYRIGVFPDNRHPPGSVGGLEREQARAPSLPCVWLLTDRRD